VHATIMTNGPYSVHVFFSGSTYFYLRPNYMFRIIVFKHVDFLFLCNNKGPNSSLTQKKNFDICTHMYTVIISYMASIKSLLRKEQYDRHIGM